MVWKGSGDPSPNVSGFSAVVFSGLGVQCGRMNVVYFTTRLYSGVRAECISTIQKLFTKSVKWGVTTNKQGGLSPKFLVRILPKEARSLNVNADLRSLRGRSGPGRGGL